MSRLEALLGRFRRIDWKVQDLPATKDDITKMRNHLIQVADLFRELKTVGPPFSPPHLLLREEESPLSQEIWEEVRVWQKGSTVCERELCWNSLEWARYCDLGNRIALEREGLYESPIDLIERRITLFYRKGYLEIGTSAYYLANWPSDFGIPSP